MRKSHLDRELDHIMRFHSGGHSDVDRPAGRSSGGRIRAAPTYRPVYAAHERDHHITTSGRRALGRDSFALPPTEREVRRGIAGRVPFDTISRARSGLARLSMMHHQGHITARQLANGRGKILRAWPEIDAVPIGRRLGSGG